METGVRLFWTVFNCYLQYTGGERWQEDGYHHLSPSNVTFISGRDIFWSSLYFLQ